MPAVFLAAPASSHGSGGWVLFWLLVIVVFVVVVVRSGRKDRPDTRLVGIMQRWKTETAPAAKLDGSEMTSIRGTDWGYTAQVELRPGQTVEDVAPRLSNIASALNAPRKAVQVEEVDGGSARDVLLRVLERDPHAEPIPWDKPSLASILDPVTLGLWQTGETVRARLAYYNGLIVGMPGSGKSGLLNLLLAELVACPNVEVRGIDFKGGLELAPWAPCLTHLATTPAEAAELIADTVATIGKRQEQLRAHGARLWKPTPAEPAIVVVVDEQAEVAGADAADKKLRLIPRQETLWRTGRALAVTGIAALQRGIQKQLGSDVIRQASEVRICTRTAEAGEADVVFGEGASKEGWRPDRLGRQGSFLISSPQQGLMLPRPARALWVDDAAVRRVVAQHGRARL